MDGMVGHWNAILTHVVLTRIPRESECEVTNVAFRTVKGGNDSNLAVKSAGSGAPGVKDEMDDVVKAGKLYSDYVYEEIGKM